MHLYAKNRVHKGIESSLFIHPSINSTIHSFNKQSLSIYYVPEIVSDAGDIVRKLISSCSCGDSVLAQKDR